MDGGPTRPPDRGAPDEGDEPGGPPGYRPTEDYSEPSRSWKSLQIGCGAVIVVAIVLPLGALERRLFRWHVESRV